ncbi:MAG: complex I NDUFA9 subunit family protein [Alphaproteobacteria bacterium]|nr:complex I NDUFA9 subunit family protein [Alphaproteobacteria bacterium]
MQQKVATVFGATGFIGRHVVRAFADAGYIVRAVSRSATKAYFLRVYGDVGQVVPVQAHTNDPASIDVAVRGADVVIYLPGVLHASTKGFTRVHRDYPAQVAEAATRHHAKRFVFVSALACDRSQSVYAQTKREGELAVLKAFPKAVVLRPSIVFGPEDGFFGRFAKLARIMPALPLIGGGHTKFQPVYVGDVAKAVFAAATKPASGTTNPEGRIYELGGPRIYSFKELLQMMFKATGLVRPLMPLPFALAAAKASVLQLLPSPPLTVDQVKSLKTDNIVASGSFGLSDLGIESTALEGMLPAMLSRYREGGPARKSA